MPPRRMGTSAEAESLQERLRSFLAHLKPRLAAGETEMDRLSRLRNLHDVRIRSFLVGKPRVSAGDLCAFLSDPRAGRLDAMATEHGLFLGSHLEAPLEPLGTTMGLMVEACLSLQVLGAEAMQKAISDFVLRNGRPAASGTASPPRAVPAAGPQPPRPLPEAVNRVLGGVKGLWAPPPHVQAALRMLEVPSTPVDRISGEIERDPPWAAGILLTLNALRGTTVGSLKRAIVMTGYPDLRKIAGPAAILARLGRAPAPFDFRAFRTHGFWTAHAAMLVSRATRLGDPEDHFLAGLLHDLGKLVVARLLPARFTSILDAAGRGGGTEAAEKAALGTGHAEIGACVAERWGLASSLAEAARHHHDPPAVLEEQELPREAPVVAALCALSRDSSRPADWMPFLRLPESRLPEIRLQASRLAEDALRAAEGSEK